MPQGGIHILLVEHRFEQDLDRRHRGFQFVRGVGDELVAQRVLMLQLFGHLVERLGQAGHLVMAGNLHARGQIAAPHALNAGRQPFDRLCDHAGESQAHHEHCGGSRRKEHHHPVLNHAQVIDHILHADGIQKHAQPALAARKRRREIADPGFARLRVAQEVERGARRARILPGKQVEPVIGHSAVENADDFRLPHAQAVELGERIRLHLAVGIDHQQAAFHFAPGGKHFLMQRLRVSTLEKRRQPHRKRFHRRRFRADFGLKQIIADQIDQRCSDGVKGHAQNQQERDQNFPANAEKTALSLYP